MKVILEDIRDVMKAFTFGKILETGIGNRGHHSRY